MTLTWKQKALRPVINFLVETWFPNGMFYGHDYFDAFSCFDTDKQVTGYTAAMYLQSIMRDHGAESISVEMHEVTQQGVPVGSYKLTLEAMPEDAPQ